MADAAERRVYFSISKSENSHADNTYEETFCTDELDSSRRHSEWQQQQTLCVVSSGNVSERLRTKHHSQSMRSAFHTLCRWIVPLQIRCHQWRGCWLQLPRLNHWMADYCASAYMAPCFFCEEMSLCCHIHWRHAVPAMLVRHQEPTRFHRRVHAYTASHLLKLYGVVNCSRGRTCSFMVQLAMTQASNQVSN